MEGKCLLVDTFATEPSSQLLRNRIPHKTRLGSRRFQGFGFGVSTPRRSTLSWRHAVHQMFPGNLSSLLPIRRLTLMCHHVQPAMDTETLTPNSLLFVPLACKAERAPYKRNSSMLSIGAAFLFSQTLTKHASESLQDKVSVSWSTYCMHRIRRLPFKAEKERTKVPSNNQRGG